MRPEDILNNAIESIKSGIDKVDNTYELHIREKAIKEVNETIEKKGLSVEQIAQDDYEAMISDLAKDIKVGYAKKAAQGLLTFIGLDMLLGI